MCCRVWIEWVPSESNPADILSRRGESPYATESGSIDVLCLLSWTDVSHKDITRVFDAILAYGTGLLAPPLQPPCSRTVHRDTKSFEASLRSALREDPDTILVGELRDLETIRLALTAAGNTSTIRSMVLGALVVCSVPNTR